MRQEIYTALTSDVAITDLVGNRIFSTFPEVPKAPFLVIRMGAARPRIGNTGSEFFQIWAHDGPGDYALIDTMLETAQIVLEAMPSQGNLFEVVWLESSGDLPMDPETGTIARYSRFQHTSMR